jgi:hypothetical protein
LTNVSATWDTPWELLILFYMGRLVNDGFSNPLVLFPSALSGIIVNPLWFIWLGSLLLKGVVPPRRNLIVDRFIPRRQAGIE